MNISFTAHRGNNESMGGYNLNSDKNRLIKSAVTNKLKDLVFKEDKVRFFLGAALTGDQLCFKACEIIKSLYPEKDIKIFLCMPYTFMGNNWDAVSYNELAREKNNSDRVFYIDHIKQYMVNGISVNSYHPGKLQKRNMFMIDYSDILMGIYDEKSKGGTYNAIMYAKKLNKNIIIINPKQVK